MKIIAPTKTKPSDTKIVSGVKVSDEIYLIEKQLSPRAQELIQAAKDKILLANASLGSAIEAVRVVYYHLLYEEKCTPLEAGDICREKLVSVFSDRTLRRALPEAAKHQNMNRSSSVSNSNTNEGENEIADSVRKSQPEIISIEQESSNRIEQQKNHILWQEREIETQRAAIDQLRSGATLEQLEIKYYKLEKENHTLGEEIKKIKEERDKLQKENRTQSYRISDLEKGRKYSIPNQQDLDELRDKVLRLETENEELRKNKRK